MASSQFPLKLPRQFSNRSFLFWLRFTLITAVFLASIIYAVLTTRHRDPLDIFSTPFFLLIPISAIILVFLRWPQLGPTALIVACLSIPYEVGTGTVTRVHSGMLILALLLVLWLFGLVMKRDRSSLARSRTILPLLLFLGIAALSFFVGQLPWFFFAQKASLFAQLGGLSIFILAAGAFLLVGSQVKDLRWLRWMTWTFLGLGALHIFARIMPGLDWLENIILPGGVINNSTFWIWLTAMAFSQAAFNEKLEPRWRWALAALFIGILYVRVVRGSGWTSGWLPSMVAIVVMLWVSRSPWSWLSLAIGAVAAGIKFESIQQLVFARNQYSLVTRLEAWKLVGQIIKVNPLLGLGPANYHWYTPLFPILGYDVRFNSHNQYIDLLAQVGILGLLFFFWFAWEMWRVGLRLREKAPAGFARAFVVGALGGFAAMLVSGMLGDWFLPFVYNIGLRGFRGSLVGWVFLGGLLALEQMILREGNPGQEV